MGNNSYRVHVDEQMATDLFAGRVPSGPNIDVQQVTASAHNSSTFTSGPKPVQTAQTTDSMGSRQSYNTFVSDGSAKNSTWSSNIGRAFKAKIRTSPLGRELGRLAMEHDMANVPRAEAKAVLGVPDDDGFHSRDSYIEMAQFSWEYARQHMKRGEKLDFAKKHLAERSSRVPSQVLDRKSRPETMICDKYMYLLDAEEGHRLSPTQHENSESHSRSLPANAISQRTLQSPADNFGTIHEAQGSARGLDGHTLRQRISSPQLRCTTSVADKPAHLYGSSLTGTPDLSTSQQTDAREEDTTIVFDEKKSSSLHFMKAPVVSPSVDASPATKRKSRNSRNRKTTVLYLDQSILSMAADLPSSPPTPKAGTMPAMGARSHGRTESQESSGQSSIESVGRPLKMSKRARMDRSRESEHVAVQDTATFVSSRHLPEIKRMSAIALKPRERAVEGDAERSTTAGSRSIQNTDARNSLSTKSMAADCGTNQDKWDSVHGKSFTSRGRTVGMSRTVHPGSSVSRTQNQQPSHGLPLSVSNTMYASDQASARRSSAIKSSQADRLATGNFPIDWPSSTSEASELNSRTRRVRRTAGEYTLFAARQSGKVRAEEREELEASRRWQCAREHFGHCQE